MARSANVSLLDTMRKQTTLLRMRRVAIKSMIDNQWPPRLIAAEVVRINRAKAEGKWLLYMHKHGLEN